MLGAAELLDLLPHRDAHLGIEAGRRLVEEEDARPVHERHRDVEAPLHAARVAARDSVGRFVEPDLLEQVLDALLDLAAAHAEDAALEAQVLAAGERDVDAVLLLDDADPAPDARGVAADVEVRDPRRPESARASVVRILTAVVLPAPFGPSRPKIVPSGTENVSPSSARTLPGYVLTRFSASIASMVVLST